MPTEKTKAGVLNKAYAQMLEMETMKRLSSDPDDPDYIRLSTGIPGVIEENTFVGRDGNLVNNWRIAGNFFQKVPAEQVQPRAEFVMQIIVKSIEEVLVEGIPTGSLKLKGFTISWNGEAQLLTFLVHEPRAVAYIQNNWEPYMTVQVGGYISNTVITQVTKDKDTSFGPAVEAVRTRKVTELVINSGTECQGEDIYDKDEVKVLENERKARIDALLSQGSRPVSKPSVEKGKSW